MRIVIFLISLFLFSCKPDISKADKKEVERLEWEIGRLEYTRDSLMIVPNGQYKNRLKIEEIEVDISFLKLEKSLIFSKH